MNPDMYVCLSEAKASHSHKMWTEDSSSIPHFLLVRIKSSGMLYFVWLGECLPTFQRSFETSVATQPTTHCRIPEHLNHAVFSCHECGYPKYFKNGGFLLRCALLEVTPCVVAGGVEPDVAQY